MVQPGSTAAANAMGRRADKCAADIGHETQDRGNCAPQWSIRHSDYPQAGTNNDTEGEIEPQLQAEKVSKLEGRVIERLRGATNLRGPHHPHDSVSQIVILEKDENREQQHKRCRRQR